MVKEDYFAKDALLELMAAHLPKKDYDIAESLLNQAIDYAIESSQPDY